MDNALNDDSMTPEERALIDQFLDDNKLFLGPDPEIMRNHSIQPRSSSPSSRTTTIGVLADICFR